MKSILLVLAASLIVFAYRQISGLRRNIALAKRSGLPYIVAREFVPPRPFPITYCPLPVCVAAWWWQLVSNPVTDHLSHSLFSMVHAMAVDS